MWNLENDEYFMTFKHYAMFRNHRRNITRKIDLGGKIWAPKNYLRIESDQTSRRRISKVVRDHCRRRSVLQGSIQHIKKVSRSNKLPDCVYKRKCKWLEIPNWFWKLWRYSWTSVAANPKSRLSHERNSCDESH